MKKRAPKPGTQQLRTEFRQRLASARRALAHTVATTDTEMQAPVAPGAHEIGEDAASSMMASILERLDGRERHELDEIEAAQARLEAGAFGVCESCHRAIPLARLRAIPTARTCAICQTRMEAAAQPASVDSGKLT